MDAVWENKLSLCRSEDILVDNYATGTHPRKQELIILQAKLQLLHSAELFFYLRFDSTLPNLTLAKREKISAWFLSEGEYHKYEYKCGEACHCNHHVEYL